MKRPLTVSILALAAASACSAPSKGALILAISTDMQTPKDIDVVSVYVSTNGVPKFDYLGRVQPDGSVGLPSTLAIVQPDHPSDPVRIRVIAFQSQGQTESARVLRDVVTTVPANRVALLRMPLNFADDGSASGSIPPQYVPNASAGVPDGTTPFDPTTIASSCDFDGTGKTSVDGVCQSAVVDSTMLPDYSDGLVFGDGGSPLAPVCFDVAACFASAVAVQGVTKAGSGCSFTLPAGMTSADLNVALATPSTGTPVNGVDLVPLESDPGEGFAVVGSTVSLVPSVCSQLALPGAGLVLATGCAPKVEATPVCEPQTPVVDAGGNPSDATLLDADADAGSLDASAGGDAGSSGRGLDAAIADGPAGDGMTSGAAPTTLVLLGSGASANGFVYKGGAWSAAKTLGSEYPQAGGGVTFLSDGRALAIARLGATYQAQSALFAGTWGSFTNEGTATTGNSVSPPFAGGGYGYLARLQDSANKVFLDTFTLSTSTWATQNTNAPMAYPNGSPAVAAVASGPVVLIPNLQAAYTFTALNGASWSPAASVPGVSLPPAGLPGVGPAVLAVTRAGVDEIVAVFTVDADAGATTVLQAATYSAGAWTAGPVVSGSLLSSAAEGAPFSLAALPDGRVALAYVDPAAAIHVGYFDGTAWGSFQVVPMMTTGNAGIYPISIAAGVGGDALELVYLGGSYYLRHTRLTNESSWTWTNSVLVDQSQTYSLVSLAAH